METRFTAAHVYTGKNAGYPILDAIRNAQESIDIISPYLGASYVDLLLEKQAQGVVVNLVTSSEYANGSSLAEIGRKLLRLNVHEDHEAIQKKKRLQSNCRIRTSLTWFVGVLCVLTGFQEPLKWIFFAACIFVQWLFSGQAEAIRTKTYSYTPMLNFAAYEPWDGIPGSGGFLMHTKLFVIDQVQAFTGSINLSESAFLRNHEIRIDIRDPGACLELSCYVRQLIDAPEGSVKHYDTIAGELYGYCPR